MEENAPPKQRGLIMRTLIVSILMCLIATTGFGTVINQIGTYTNWTSTWTSLGGYDADNGVDSTAEFVGNAANPGLYWANNGSYVMFRMRVDQSPYQEDLGTHLVLIDIAGNGVSGIDYAFSWDSYSKNNAWHGLEMNVRHTVGSTWGTTDVTDNDGSEASKLSTDINGGGRTTDGYIRTTDKQATADFSDTTFIDFAVSWGYLETYTSLRQNQSWSIQLASINGGTDHSNFNADIGGGADLSSAPTVGWTVPIAIPEPATDMLLVLGGGLAWLFSRRKRR
jgi:hypothetical protein